MAEETGLAVKGGFLLNEGGFLNVTDTDDGCDDCCEQTTCPVDCTSCPNTKTLTMTGLAGDCACANSIGLGATKSGGSCNWSGFIFGVFGGACPFGSADVDVICDSVNGWTFTVALLSMGVSGLTNATYVATTGTFESCPPNGALTATRTSAPAGGCPATATITVA